MVARRMQAGDGRQAHNLIHIGTSGWHYDHWKGPFYPVALPSDKMLGFYAGQFRTAEINNTFYQLPSADTGGGTNVSLGEMTANRPSPLLHPRGPPKSI